MTNEPYELASLPAAHRQTPSGKLRARGAGIPFAGSVGAHNAITDVPGVEVGYESLVFGEAMLGESVARTGVTAILPSGLSNAESAVWAGVASLNGNGEMTGFPWIEETGRCEGPITLTNTHSLGTARDATVGWLAKRHLTGSALDARWWLPVAAETWDGVLNDLNAAHVKPAHVVAAIESARSGPLEEGSVGGGTGMICYGFKAGSGTASRLVSVGGTTYALGVFVQANFGAQGALHSGRYSGRRFAVGISSRERCRAVPTQRRRCWLTDRCSGHQCPLVAASVAAYRPALLAGNGPQWRSFRTLFRRSVPGIFDAKLRRCARGRTCCERRLST